MHALFPKTRSFFHQLNLKRRSIFYGWVVWAAATLIAVASTPGQTFAISRYIDYFIADFHLDRSTISLLYGTGTMLAALVLTWFGRKLDRYGSRVTGVITIGMFVLVLGLMALVNGVLALLIGFIALRALGHGAMGMISSTSIAQWFIRRRGRMLSLMFVGFALFRSIYVPLLQHLLEQYGWRQVWVMQAVWVGIVGLPIIWFLMRDRPEDLGLQPDGEAPPAQSHIKVEEPGWTLAEARHTTIFWVFLLARIVAPAFGAALVFHQVSIFAEAGYPASTAAQIDSMIALVTAGMSLLSGYIIDRFHPRRVLTFQLVGLIAALFMAMHMQAVWMIAVYGFAFGIVMGNGGVFDGTAWAALFGREHLGAIRGFSTTMFVIGNAIGPMLLGFSYDYLGGYDAALWLGIGIAFIPLMLTLVVKEPVYRADLFSRRTLTLSLSRKFHKH